MIITSSNGNIVVIIVVIKYYLSENFSPATMIRNRRMLIIIQDLTVFVK